jgi:hypothetical protein
MRDPLFAWAIIVLTVLGLSQAVIEWFFWRRLSTTDPAQLQQRLGVAAVTDRRSIGFSRVWRFLLKREYSQIAQAPVLLGDLLRVLSIAFALTLLGLFGAFAFRFVGLWLHNAHQ